MQLLAFLGKKRVFIAPGSEFPLFDAISDYVFNDQTCPETLGAQFCIKKCSITYYCFVDQEKTYFLVNYCRICQHFWHLWMIFDYLFNSNGLKHSKINLFHAEYSIDIQKLCVNTVFSQ